MQTDAEHKSHREAWIGCLQLTLAMAAAMVILGYAGYQSNGEQGLQFSLTAGSVCWLGALLALVTTALTRTPERATAGVLAAMIFRLGFPLLALFILRESTPNLRESGLLFHLLVYYLVGLALETVLAVKLVKRTESGQKAT